MPEHPTGSQDKRRPTTKEVAALHRLRELVDSSWVDWGRAALSSGDGKSRRPLGLKGIGPLVRPMLMLVLATACSTGEPPPPALQGPSFTLSTDPTEVVLLLTYKGGLSGAHYHYALHGDGALHIAERDHRGQLLPSSVPARVQLSDSEVVDLVGIAVSSGLMDVDGRELMARMESETGRALDGIVADGADMIVEFRLASYSGESGTIQGLDHRIRLHSPRVMLRLLADYPELQGLVLLGEELSRIRMGLQDDLDQ